MEPLTAGTVVLVRFPFSDLSQAKLRPAVMLADVGRGDYILCQITSNLYADPFAVELTDASFASGSLQRTSYIRPGKLFTAHRSLVQATMGVLQGHAIDELRKRIGQLLQLVQSPGA